MQFFLVVCFVISSSVIAVGEPIVGYVSSGLISYPNSLAPSDNRNINADASITQNWTYKDAFGSNDFVLYTTLSGQRDSDGNGYASKQKVSFGGKIKIKVRRSANLAFGIRYDFDNRDLSKEFYKNLVLTADYGLWKRLPTASNGDPRLLSAWANLRYPGGSDDSNKDNWVSQGRLELSREIKSFQAKGNKPKFMIFGGLGFGLDTEGYEYNNKIKVDTGMRLRWRIGRLGLVNLNLRYTLDRRIIQDKTYHGPSVSASWYVPF